MVVPGCWGIRDGVAEAGERYGAIPGGGRVCAVGSGHDGGGSAVVADGGGVRECVCVSGEGVFVCRCIALLQWQRNYPAETFSNRKKVAK